MTTPSPRTPRIAVIAVHGVADQQRDATNADVASLLAEHFGGERRAATYSPFAARRLHLPQHPLGNAAARARAPGAGDQSLRAAFRDVHDHREYIHASHQAAGRSDEPDGELGYHFMRMQLAAYTPDAQTQTYVTTVLESVRRPTGEPAAAVATVRAGGDASRPLRPDAPAAAPGGEQHVDIYEVHWADLSRLGTGVFAFFGAAYQLLLHLATLGRQAVDDATTELTGWAWKAADVVQRVAVRGLTLPIPLLNVLLLCVALGVFPAKWLLGASWGPAVALALVLGGGATVAAYVGGRARVPRSPGGWTALALLPAAGGALLAVLLEVVLRRFGRTLDPVPTVAFAWWAVTGVVLYVVARKYQRLRAGALAWAARLFAVAGLVFAAWTFVVEPKAARGDLWRFELVTLRTMQALFALLRLSWGVVMVGGLLLVGLWWLARATTRGRPEAWARGRAALRTGRLALALSAGPFLVLTIVIWAGVFSYTVRKTDAFARVEAADFRCDYLPHWLVPAADSVAALDSAAAARDVTIAADSLAALDRAARAPGAAPVVAAARLKADSALRLARLDRDTLKVSEYMQGLIAGSVTAGTPVSLACGVAALLLLLWTALPSVLAESSTQARCSNGESRRFGRWLSRGLDSTRWVGYFLFAGAILVPLVFGTLTGIGRPLVGARLGGVLTSLLVSAYRMVDTLGALVAASAVVVVTVIAKRGGSALDTLLDVDNYLRTRPVRSTPRARIAERYVAVLRHIATAEDEHGAGRYDGVVIVAHSLGALITADLLRYLGRERARGGDPALARLGFGPADAAGAAGGPEIPITLFTMGNPLRQLLNRFFPHRYQWVRAVPDNAVRPLPADVTPRAVAADFTRPDVGRLGVARWESAYRSGDYVGRSLWLDEWYHRGAGGDDDGAYDDRPCDDGPHGAGCGKAPLAYVVPADAAPGAPARVAEYCIGMGAHLHYWTVTAPDVADRIDALIASAHQVAAPPRPVVAPAGDPLAGDRLAGDRLAGDRLAPDRRPAPAGV